MTAEVSREPGSQTTGHPIRTALRIRIPPRTARHKWIQWFEIGRALAGQPITLYDEGQFKRDINYVDDVVEALLLAGERDAAIGEAFNLGSPPVSLREFVETLGEVIGGVDLHFIPYPPQRRQIEIGDTYCEYGKISRTLNWLPRTALHDGLERTVAWHRARAQKEGPA